MDFATRIRTARRKSGMSQQVMAERLGVSRGAVSNWEGSGQVRPSTDNLIKIAEVTGIAFEWLATEQGSMKPGQLPESHSHKEQPAIRDTAEGQLLDLLRSVSMDKRMRILEVVASMLLLLHD